MCLHLYLITFQTNTGLKRQFHLHGSLRGVTFPKCTAHCASPQLVHTNTLINLSWRMLLCTTVYYTIAQTRPRPLKMLPSVNTRKGKHDIQVWWDMSLFGKCYFREKAIISIKSLFTIHSLGNCFECRRSWNNTENRVSSEEFIYSFHHPFLPH